MSINDKVQVLWKTNCEWRDRPHWPKRREIKLRQGDSAENSILPLKPGDLVRIKFGSRWYDTEVAEHWNPKSKKGMCLQLLEFMIRIVVKKRISKDGTSRRIN